MKSRLKSEARRSPGPEPGRVVRGLTKRYGSVRTGADPFSVLVATVLSQRCRDATTDSVTDRLLSVYPTAGALAAAPVGSIEKLIRRSGFYRVKAERLKRIARIIMDEYGGEVPREVERLLELPGVGRKTANCVLVYGFGADAIPVDTHVHRISNRLGWVKTKTPEQTEKALEKFLDRKHWIPVNKLLVEFGKDICRPVRPRCGDCPFSGACPASSC